MAKKTKTTKAKPSVTPKPARKATEAKRARRPAAKKTKGKKATGRQATRTKAAKRRR